LHPRSYILNEDIIFQLKKRGHKYWISKDKKYFTPQQKIVDLVLVGENNSLVKKKWKKLVQHFETKKKEMIETLYQLHPTFDYMIKKDLISLVTIMGQVGTDKRLPTEDDVDILISATSPKNYSSIRKILIKNANMFKLVTWVEQNYDRRSSYCSPVYFLRKTKRKNMISMYGYLI
jgi:hypothetical protein